jgi:tetratricopeptide (TPR) repeat protein
MRSTLRALTATSFLLTLASIAQSPKPVRCAVQAPTPVTDADRSFIAGDAAKSEALYTAQLAASPTVASYAGLVRSQLQQNKLTEGLATAQHAASALPASADAQALIGDALTRAGQIPEASDAYSKALTLSQCSPRAHFGVGRLAELVSRHATAARELALAHNLAPADPEIAQAYFEVLPDAQRQIALHALLNAHPVLAPEDIERVTSELAILDQKKTCTAIAESATAPLVLAPLMFNGTYERSWGVNVRLNNATSLLELDTSVSGIVLNPRDAERAGVHPLSSAPVSANAPYLAVADRVRIGALEYHDCPVRVVPASALADSNSVIGADFFRDHLIHIDYVAKLLTLSPYPVRPGLAPNAVADQYIAPEEQDWSPVYIANGKVLVPTLINKKGPYLLLLDSGIGTSVLSPSVTSKLLLAAGDATLNLRGVSADIIKVLPRDGGGEVDITDIHGPTGARLRVTTPVRLPIYRFTKNERPDEHTISFDLSPISHDTGIEISGLMGFHVLRNYFVDINYRDGLARILFDQNRRYEARLHEKSERYLEY